MPSPTDYFFMRDVEGESYLFVEKKFWQENECIDDCIAEGFEDILPESETVFWTNDMESAYSPIIKGSLNRETGEVKVPTTEEAIKMLVDAGFTQIDNPWS